MLTLESFEQASEIVKQVTQETKLIKSSYFSELTGNKVYLKPENMQRTGAYKVRGAYYKISTLSDEERNFLENYFDDLHSGNFGFNAFGEVKIFDYACFFKDGLKTFKA